MQANRLDIANDRIRAATKPNGIPQTEERLDASFSASLSLAQLIAVQRSTIPPSEFSKFCVEQLLNQSNDILDRVLRDRSLLAELEYRQFLEARQAHSQHLELKHARNMIDAGTYEWERDWIVGQQTTIDSVISNLNRANEIANDIYRSNETVKSADGKEGVSYAQTWSKGLQLHSTYAQYDVFKLRKAELDAKSTWLVQANTLAKTDLDQRELAFDKALDVVNRADYALGGEARAELLAKSIARDFVDALSRLATAAAGLRQIFGLGLPADIEPYFASIDSAVYFSRSCTRWLSAYIQRDQSSQMLVSVAKAVGPREWTKACASPNPRFEVLLPPQRIATLKNVRLASVTPSSISSTSNARPIFSAVLTLPRKAVYARNVFIEVDQSDLPAISLGRVSIDEFRKPSDAAHNAGVVNASPFGFDKPEGRCVLEIVEFQAGSISDLQDILLEFAFIGNTR